MAELLRTTDIVLLSYVNFLLSEAGIPVLVADVHVSAVEGSIGAFCFPRRVLIAAEDWDESAAILTEAGLAAHLAPPPEGRREWFSPIRLDPGSVPANDLAEASGCLENEFVNAALPGMHKRQSSAGVEGKPRTCRGRPSVAAARDRASGAWQARACLTKVGARRDSVTAIKSTRIEAITAAEARSRASICGLFPQK